MSCQITRWSTVKWDKCVPCGGGMWWCETHLPVCASVCRVVVVCDGVCRVVVVCGGMWWCETHLPGPPRTQHFPNWELHSEDCSVYSTCSGLLRVEVWVWHSWLTPVLYTRSHLYTPVTRTPIHAGHAHTCGSLDTLTSAAHSTVCFVH